MKLDAIPTKLVPRTDYESLYAWVSEKTRYVPLMEDANTSTAMIVWLRSHYPNQSLSFKTVAVIQADGSLYPVTQITLLNKPPKTRKPKTLKAVLT